MSTENHVIGWGLDREERARLLEVLPPRYPDVAADHVTLESHVEADTPPPPDATCEIIGRADDGEGVEAMVVRINGTTARPDGGVFHITWSLDRARGRRAVESNTVIAETGWATVPAQPVAIRPVRFTSRGGG